MALQKRGQKNPPLRELELERLRVACNTPLAVKEGPAAAAAQRARPRPPGGAVAAATPSANMWLQSQAVVVARRERLNAAAPSPRYGAAAARADVSDAACRRSSSRTAR